MAILDRYSGNPILRPNPDNDWESFAVFNGNVVKTKENYLLFYRAIGTEQEVQNRHLRLSVIGQAESQDGYNFVKRKIFLEPTEKWEQFGCEDPRVTKIDNQYLLFYTALSNYPPNHLGIKVAAAELSLDFKIKTKHLITPFNGKAMTLFPEKINGLYTVLLTVDPDKLPSYVAMAQFADLETLYNRSFWLDWYQRRHRYIVNLRRVNSDHVEVGAPPLKTADGWLLIYSYIKHYTSENLTKEFRIEAVLLDLHNPQKIIGRIEKPLLTPEADYEQNGVVKNVIFPQGALLENKQLRVYYGASDNYCALAKKDWESLRFQFETNAPYTLKMNKFSNNPLLEPIAQHDWENEAVFNAAAIELENKIYLIYRGLSKNKQSNFGLAISDDGYFIDERLPEPIYPLRSQYELAKIHGKPSGVEDPRITQIGDKSYLCFTAYDGELPRLGFSWITVRDFLNRNWQAWAETKIISPPGVGDKDGALFPEKINDKYVFFHRLEPNIVIDNVVDLEFKSPHSYLESEGIIQPRYHSWDEVKIGVNGPPIKTQYGWLVFYHGISKIDRHYRIGAFLLDLEDVTKVIGRTAYPILEPETEYERKGIVNNVVFSNGQVVKGDEIIIYYGAADKVLCGAKIKQEKLINYIFKSSQKQYLR
jgi:predicted GH43/DUF377 family glycosyl hydrolase